MIRNLIYLAITILLYGCGTLCTVPLVTIKGTVEVNEDGRTTIVECGTGKIFELGILASNQYSNFMNKYENLKTNGSVLVEVEGSGAHRENSIQYPEFKSIKNGICK